MTRHDAFILWAPRVLAIAFIGFVSLFALDVFSGGRGVAETAVALALHLIPSAVLAAIVALAWRREWIGALCFGAAGALYVWWALSKDVPAFATRLLWCMTIAGPAFLVAALYGVSWRARRADAPR
jgi:hypothetical protein